MNHGVIVRPIKSDQDLSLAIARISELMNAKVGTPEGDELDVLATLVQAYEREHVPIAPSDPVDAIQFWMDQKGLQPKDLIPFLGAQSRVSQILNRRRRLSLEMIRRLHEGLGMPVESLIGTTR